MSDYQETPTETQEANETSAETQPENLSQRGISAMQGREDDISGQVDTPAPEQTNEEPPADVPQSPDEDIPDQGDRHLKRPSHIEAREGSRNVEDGMQEGDYDYPPGEIEEDPETKPGGLKWRPGGLERGG